MHRIFRDHPEVIDQTFRVLDFTFPETKATSVISTDVTEIRPIERRVDTVMKVEAKDERSFILVFEAQRKVDADKLASWPYYLAYLHDKHRLPVLLIVVCQDHATAKWASAPIMMSVEDWPSMRVQPLVVGPHNIPAPQGPIDQAGILLGVLAAIAHAREPGIDGILKLMATALKGTDASTRSDLGMFIQLGVQGLPAEQTWRGLMMWDIETLRTSEVFREILDEHDEQVAAASRAQGEAEGRAQGEAEGAAKAKAENILSLLAGRDIQLTDAERNRVETCRDLGTLDRWFDAAISAASADDLFV
jgi:hypothetical protein